MYPLPLCKPPNLTSLSRFLSWKMLRSCGETFLPSFRQLSKSGKLKHLSGCLEEQIYEPGTYLFTLIIFKPLLFTMNGSQRSSIVMSQNFAWYRRCDGAYT